MKVYILVEKMIGHKACSILAMVIALLFFVKDAPELGAVACEVKSVAE